MKVSITVFSKYKVENINFASLLASSFFADIRWVMSQNNHLKFYAQKVQTLIHIYHYALLMVLDNSLLSLALCVAECLWLKNKTQKMVQIVILQCYVSGYYKLSDEDYYILLIILLCKFQVPHTSCCGAVPGKSVRFLYNRNCHILNDICI